MKKFLEAEDSTIEFLKTLGMEVHDRGLENITYLTHHGKGGKQIKIDTKNSFITFIDEKGYIVSEGKYFTQKEVEYFLNN